MKGQRHLTIVIKIGTSSIVDEKTHEPILSILSLIVETAIKLRRDGHRVVIVSSGAIGVGLQRMSMPKRPKHLAQVQALAAIGQSRLMSIWDSLFAHMSQPVAQILLTRNDIADRSQYLNAQNTLSEVLSMGVIPIVNENDTLAVSEIKFGDNDTLSAITAAMVNADYLFLMTDVDCLYDKNPRKFSDAVPIMVVEDIDALKADVSSKGSALGTGGMATKIIAARLASSAGTSTIITKSSKPGNISDIIHYYHPPVLATSNGSAVSMSSSMILNHPSGSTAAASHGATPAPSTPQPSTPTIPPPLHTRFVPSPTPIRNRAFWILHGLAPRGTIYIDRGASTALQNKAGLLPVGILGVEGVFAQQEAVRLVVVDKTSMGTLSPSPELSSTTSTLNSNPSLTSSTISPPTSGSTTTSISNNPSTTTPTRTTSPHRPTAHRSPSCLTNSFPQSILSVPTSTTSTSVLHHTLLQKGEEIGRAVVNYSSNEIQRVKGLRSSEIESVLGYADSEYVAYRENVSLNPVDHSRPVTPPSLAHQLGLMVVGGAKTPTRDRTPEGSWADLRAGH